MTGHDVLRSLDQSQQVSDQVVAPPENRRDARVRQTRHPVQDLLRRGFATRAAELFGKHQTCTEGAQGVVRLDAEPVELEDAGATVLALLQGG